MTVQHFCKQFKIWSQSRLFFICWSRCATYCTPKVTFPYHLYLAISFICICVKLCQHCTVLFTKLSCTRWIHRSIWVTAKWKHVPKHCMKFGYMYCSGPWLQGYCNIRPGGVIIHPVKYIKHMGCENTTWDTEISSQHFHTKCLLDRLCQMGNLNLCLGCCKIDILQVSFEQCQWSVKPYRTQWNWYLCNFSSGLIFWPSLISQ